MAEDKELAEELEAEEAEDVEEIETPSEELPEKEVKKPSLGRARIKNPIGLIFNLRMLRRVVQILFLLGINAYIFAAWTGGEQIVAFWQAFRDILPTLPIIAPLEGTVAVLAGSFDTLQREFTAGIFPFFTIGAMIIILTIVGRAGCGWICPIGTIQDFATLPKRKKAQVSPKTETDARKFKVYIFILVMFFALWVGYSRILGTANTLTQLLGPFANAAFSPINPAYIIFVVLPPLPWPTDITTLWYFTQWGWAFAQLVLVALVVVIAFWYPRWFCRWICPAGWLYSVFSRDALIGIGRNPARCTPDVCNVCEAVCPMNIRIRRYPYQHMHSPDCIMCLECKSHCPNNAIEIRFS
jgi:ferredoxin-type protein NapH